MKKFLMLCLLALVAVAYAEDKYIDHIKILMTEQEKAEFKKLKSDSEKQKFVDDFWAKRDPSPGTPENEYKTNFENNLQQVNDRMKDKKAFESDLGQTLLLLGPPSDQKDEGGKSSGYNTESDEDTGGAPGKKIWIYKSLPSDVASGEITIEFRPSGGEWRFADKKTAGAILEKARVHTMAAQVSAHGTQEIPAKQPEMAPSPSTADVPPVTTPEVKAALDATATGTAPTDVSMNTLADSFMSSEGEVFSTFAISTTADAAGAKVGIRVMDPSGAVVKETELPFVDATANPPEAAGYFQTKLPVTAGEYSVALAVVGAGKAGGAKKTLTVPDYAGKFGISSVILSRKFNTLSEAKPEKTPYTFGKIKVDPDAERTFTKADDLIIVYEVYNFQNDATGKPNVEVVISFQKGNEKPKSTQPSPANGLVTGKKMTIPTSFPLTVFPPGDWKVKVSVTDKVSNQTASQEAPFIIKLAEGTGNQ
jgi:GWxTD domain-containing protein